MRSVKRIAMPLPHIPRLSRGFYSLRVRVTILLAFLLLSILTVFIYQALQNRQEMIKNAMERVSATARLVAEEQNNTIAYAQQFLGFLAETRNLSNFVGDPKCPEILAEKLRREPRFANIAVVASNGDLVCAAVPTAGVVNIADREYFKKALTASGPVIGEANVGRASGKWTLPLTLAMRDKSGRVQSIFLVSLDLQWVSNHLARGNYPPDSRLGLIDDNGLVVARYPDAEKWTGRNASQTAFFKMIKAHQGTGTADAPGFEGTPRYYGFARFAETVTGPIYLWVGVSRSSVVEHADRQFAWTLSGALLLLVTTFGAVWIGGERLIMRPVSAMSKATRRLGEGDPAARTGLKYTNNELGQLARSIDEMAESLASTSEILRANRALRVLSALNQTLVHAADESALLQSMCRAIVEAGGFRMAWVGYAETDDAKSVRPVASWGTESGYLENLRVTWADNEHGQGPTGKAIRGGTPVVMRNMQTDPHYAPWREAAARYRYESSVAIPLILDGRTFGTLNLYAAEPDAFDDAEIALLVQGAADLCFGIGSQRSKAQLALTTEQIRAASRYSRKLLEASLDPLVTISPEGKITDANETTATVTGVPRTNLIGSDFSEYFTEPEKARAGYQEAYANGFVIDYPLSIRHVSGRTIDVLYNASLYTDEKGNVAGLFAAARDVTARNRAEAEIRELNATLEQRVLERTAQLEATNKELESFSYSVSHDLRAPLRTIDGFSLALLEDYADRLDDEGKDNLNRVRAATQRMGHLIDDLLKLSRLTRAAMALAPVDLTALAHAIAEELKTSDPARNVIFEIAPKLEAIGDMQLLTVMLENLLGNAWKFTGKRATAHIEFGMTEKDGEAVFFVRDDGAGFDMTHVATLFAPFQRLHSVVDFPGTGIGLVTVQRVVHRHGGRVWAEGVPGRGATFYFTLPAAKTSADLAQPAAAFA